jgi:hypothetical protein
MSVSNFGSNFRSQSVTNLTAADIVIPIDATNAVTSTPLIQTALFAEIPLVLGAGVWAITARVALNMFNGDGTYDQIQADLVQNASIVATCPMACGADVVDGTNQSSFGSLSYIVTLNAPTSFYWRLRTAGNSRAIDVTSGYPHIVATKLSA